MRSPYSDFWAEPASSGTFTRAGGRDYVATGVRPGFAVRVWTTRVKVVVPRSALPVLGIFICTSVRCGTAASFIWDSGLSWD